MTASRTLLGFGANAFEILTLEMPSIVAKPPWQGVHPTCTIIGLAQKTELILVLYQDLPRSVDDLGAGQDFSGFGSWELSFGELARPALAGV